MPILKIKCKCGFEGILTTNGDIVVYYCPNCTKLLSGDVLNNSVDLNQYKKGI